MAALLGHAGDGRIAEEQAALRRVATMVARAAAPEAVFAAVTGEAGRLLGVDYATMARYDPDGARTVVASWSSRGAGYPVGNRARLGGRNVQTLVFRTGEPARIDDYAGASGPLAEAAREFGFRAAVGAPVRVEGRLWGVMYVSSTREEPLPAGTEHRLAEFTELAATAIANAQARVDLRGFAKEQAALRRVAMLVARAAPPAQVLTAVTEEAGRLLHADHATMKRYGPDETVSVIATWGSTGASFPVGASAKLGGRNLQTMIFQTRRPARMDDTAGISGSFAELVRELGLHAAVGVPVSVEGRLWGNLVVASPGHPCPGYGAQQRLVSLALDLQAAQAAAAPGTGELAHQLDHLASGLDDVLEDLREIARGLHPAILAQGGLRLALKTLARRSAVPVRLDIQIEGRLPELVETAAYYTVSEALTNAAKHARATAADIEADTGDGVLRVRVRDNGRGGADFSDGSGLLGLKDRAEALGSRLRLDSPPGAGTSLEIELPLEPGGPVLPPEPGW